MNLRLVRAFQIRERLMLQVRHKPGKQHIILDALISTYNMVCQRAQYKQSKPSKFVDGLEVVGKALYRRTKYIHGVSGNSSE